MNRMRVRYDIQDMSLKISNVTLPKAEDSYVLITISDQSNHEIVIELSREQAEYLQDELYVANRRRREYSSPTRAALNEMYTSEPVNEENIDLLK